jgi:exopolysaccharide production protein ExoQ
MNSSFASVLCIAGIASLFYANRNRSLRTSKALWLPILWLLIIGSRPVSVWLGITPELATAEQAAEGSPLDAIIFGVLLAVAIMVLIRRKERLSFCLKANWPCLIYFAYCILSVLWSDFPGIAFKRWIKAVGDLAMVLVLATDHKPEAAFGRVISRVGFILMPASVLLIKYFAELGRGYDPDGNPMNNGVATQKNSLGLITLVIALGAMWHFLNVLQVKRQRNRTRVLLAQGTLLAFCIAVLVMAQSATSIACFILGAILLLAAHMPMIRRRPRAMHTLVVLMFLSGGVIKILGGQAAVVHALGRKPDLTGRADIWSAVLSVASNPIVGAGFESFWLGPRLELVYSRLSGYQHVNEAHNGYIEVYLNLGLIGVGLVAIILISGYRGAISTFRRHPEFGGLMLAYVAAAAFYGISEAGFRMLSPMWMFLLFAVVSSRSIALREGGATDSRSIRSRAGRFTELPTSHELNPVVLGD